MDLESPDSPKLGEEEATHIEVEEVQPGTPEEQSPSKIVKGCLVAKSHKSMWLNQCRR